jgi:HD-GYP domain-containing protein (c-di-GMP phosphodiesterase class II)
VPGKPAAVIDKREREEMNGIPVSSLSMNGYFDQPVFLDEKYILLTPDSPVTDELIKRLKKWKYNEVFTEGRAKDVPSYLSGADNTSITSQTLDQDIHEREDMSAARKFYSELRVFTAGVFSQFVTDGTLNLADVTEMVKKTIRMVRERRDYLLRSIEMDGSSDDYLVSHSVNSTILSVIIGDYLKAPPHRLIELGNACLLHEIGMLKLPPELRRSSKKINDDERRVIITHTAIGYRILKGISAPENVALAAIEHHERMDGSGYPRNLIGDKITEYARIIAVACSYDAIVSKRPFKNIALDGHSAIKDLLQKNRKQYDDRVLKALVYTLSVYPVGTAVLLSNQGKGIVIKTDPEKPRCPVVKVTIDPDGKKLTESKMIQTSDGIEGKGIVIQRVLSGDEAQEVRSAL